MRSVSPFSLSLVTYLVTFATSSPSSILSLQAVVLRRPSEVFIATPLYIYDRLRASTPSAHEHPIVRSHSPSSHAHPKTASPSLRPRIRRSLAHALRYPKSPSSIIVYPKVRPPTRVVISQNNSSSSSNDSQFGRTTF